MLEFAPPYEQCINQNMKGFMEVSKSELRLYGERMRAIAVLQRVENTHRELSRKLYSLPSIKNESILIAGEAVGHNEGNLNAREKRHGSSIHVEKSDDGESDGDPEPDSRRGSLKKKTANSHRPDYGVLPAEGFVRLPKILEVIPVSRSSWWAGIQAGKYPKGIKLGPRTTVWPVEAVRTLINPAEDV